MFTCQLSNWGYAFSFKINFTIYASHSWYKSLELCSWCSSPLLSPAVSRNSTSCYCILGHSAHVWTASNLDNPAFETYWEYQTYTMVLVEGKSLCLQETTAEEHLSIFVLPWFVSQGWCDHYGVPGNLRSVDNPLLSCPNLLFSFSFSFHFVWNYSI